MKKIIETLRKKDIDVLVFLLIVISGISLFVLVNCEDELWNFANCYKMFNGYKIYEEINVIITPLFFYIAQIFLKVFGNNLLAFRIYNIFIFLVFLFLIYFIFKSLKIVKRRAALYVTIIMYIFCGMITAGANYNILSIIPILIAVLLIINKKENNLLLGILLCITFLIKQNVYVYFAMGLFINKFFGEGNIKTKIIDLFKIYFISMVGIIIFLTYLYLDGNLYNFINYCFLGMSEFGIKNLALSFSGVKYIYISIIVIIFTIFIINNKKTRLFLDDVTIKNLKTLLSFGIPLLLISYPIINYYHATLSCILIIIEFMYVIEYILIQNLQIKIKKEKWLYISFIFLFIIYIYYKGMIIGISEINKGNIILNNEGVFYGSLIKKEDYKDIEIICNYIKEQEKNNVEVKILSYKANLYMVKLDKNNGVFDLAFVGNLGEGGEEYLVDKIKKMDNSILLIQTDSEKIFWQESKKVRDYIISNYNKIGEIQEYSIFYIN